jgi:hypothetical protein
MQKDDFFDELRNGLIGQFRKLIAREGELKEELRVSDALANLSGKVTNTYRVEVAWDEHSKGGEIEK